MATPYIGEIKIFGGNFAPLGWAFCDGSSLPINGNEALYNLLGTTYGGDGINNFNLPDLRGRVPMHVSPGYPQGVRVGSESVTLNISTMPSHNHMAMDLSTPGSTTSPQNAFWAASSVNDNHYKSNPVGPTPMNNLALTLSGNGQPHENRQPYMAINYIIALVGVYPSQN